MPNFKAHAIVGGLSGLGIACYEYHKIKETNPDAEIDLLKVLACIAAGVAGAIIPDKLEPATNPNHRSFFHSYTFGGGGAVAFKSISEFFDSRPGFKYPAYAFLLGYGSHLILDGRTPKGLPLLS